MTSKNAESLRQLQQWLVFYHITAMMRYNPVGKDNSQTLLRKGVIPHRGEGANGQESGFFVWTTSKKAIRHSYDYALGPRSLVTLKVPVDSVRFPDWTFDVEGLGLNPFLLDGLCAKHQNLVKRIFKQPDFQKEIEAVIGCDSHLRLVHQRVKPCLVFYNKNNDIIGTTDKFDWDIGAEMLFQAELCLPELKAEIERVHEASKKRTPLPEYKMPFNGREMFQLMRDDVFAHQFLSRFSKEILSLNDNPTVIEALRKHNHLYDTAIERFDMCLSPTKTVVRKYIDNVKHPLGEQDIVYERILNALLRRCPAMQKSYNELLERKVQNRPIIFMVQGVPYAPAPFYAYPLKYTGDEVLPVYSVTPLSREKNKHNRIHALSKPVLNPAFQRKTPNKSR